MVWRRAGDKPLYLNQWWLVYWRIYASLCLSQLITRDVILGCNVSYKNFEQSNVCLRFIHYHGGEPDSIKNCWRVENQDGPRRKWTIAKLVMLSNTTRGIVPWRCESNYPMAWWRHQMETFSALLALCAGNSPVSGELQRPVTRSFHIFFGLCLITRLSKHSRGWWFETLSHPLWRHCNGDVI